MFEVSGAHRSPILEMSKGLKRDKQEKETIRVKDLHSEGRKPPYDVSVCSLSPTRAFAQRARCRAGK
jgi:hypothetical protein